MSVQAGTNEAALTVSEFKILFSILFEFSYSGSRVVLGILTMQRGNAGKASHLLTNCTFILLSKRGATTRALHCGGLSAPDKPYLSCSGVLGVCAVGHGHRNELIHSKSSCPT